MAKELTLILAEDIEKLTPAMIAFNNEELLAAVDEQLKQYENTEYSEQQINEAKENRARLNAVCKRINDARLRIGKVYLSPYDNFKTKVDEVIHRIKVVSDKIDATVKTYESRIKQEKEKEIRDYFNNAVGGYAEVLSFDRIFNQKWLNVSVKLPTIQKEIDSIIDNVKNAMIAIEALNSEDEKYIKSYYFRTLDLSDAIMENTRLQQERERIEKLNALKKKQEAEEKESTVQAVKEPIVTADNPDKTEEKTCTIEFSVTATIAEFKALKQFLQSNNIQYKAIRR